MTTGGATRVLMLRNTLKVRTMMPSRFSRLASVIFTAFADFTRKITDILRANIANVSFDPSFNLEHVMSCLFNGSVALKRILEDGTDDTGGRTVLCSVNLGIPEFPEILVTKSAILGNIVPVYVCVHVCVCAIYQSYLSVTGFYNNSYKSNTRRPYRGKIQARREIQNEERSVEFSPEVRLEIKSTRNYVQTSNKTLLPDQEARKIHQVSICKTCDHA